MLIKKLLLSASSEIADNGGLLYYQNTNKMMSPLSNKILMVVCKIEFSECRETSHRETKFLIIFDLPVCARMKTIDNLSCQDVLRGQVLFYSHIDQLFVMDV